MSSNVSGFHIAAKGGSLALRREPHPGVFVQHSFVRDRADVLVRSGVSGHRLVIALHLVLSTHEPEAATATDGSLHLRCSTCRTDDLEPAAQYPCPTAQHAFWALDAVLG